MDLISCEQMSHISNLVANQWNERRVWCLVGRLAMVLDFTVMVMDSVVKIEP